MSEITPSQTVGPFFAYGLAPHSRCEWRPEQRKDIYDWKETAGANLVTPDASGTKIRIEGQVLDGDGMPINDAMIEVWQADAQCRYAHPADNRARPNTKFMGFGRSATGLNSACTRRAWSVRNSASTASNSCRSLRAPVSSVPLPSRTTRTGDVPM